MAIETTASLMDQWQAQALETRMRVWGDVPDEKWNDWRWQLSNRLNSLANELTVQAKYLTELQESQPEHFFGID